MFIKKFSNIDGSHVGGLPVVDVRISDFCFSTMLVEIGNWSNSTRLVEIVQSVDSGGICIARILTKFPQPHSKSATSLSLKRTRMEGKATSESLFARTPFSGRTHKKNHACVGTNQIDPPQKSRKSSHAKSTYTMTASRTSSEGRFTNISILEPDVWDEFESEKNP